MKKSKFMLLLLVSIISFSYGINYIKALATCDFDNYGTFELRTQKEVNSYDSVKNSENNLFPNRLTSDDSGIAGNIIVGNKLNGWSDQELKFYHVYAMEDGYINTAKFTMYSEDEEGNPKAQCEYSVNVKELCKEIEGQTCETFKFMFTLNKKGVKQIVFDGTYYDASGNGPIDFTSNTLTVNKAGTDGANADHTTVAGKPIQNPIQKHIDSGSELGAASGTAKGSAKPMIQTDKDGNVINSYDKKQACTSVKSIVRDYWKYVMIIAPVLLIVVITLDFFKALSSNDADAIKKAGTNTVKRTIATVILLALPALLGIVFDLFGLDLCV